MLSSHRWRRWMDQNYEEWGPYEEKSQYCVTLYLQDNPLKTSPPASPTLEEKKKGKSSSCRDWSFTKWCSAKWVLKWVSNNRGATCHKILFGRKRYKLYWYRWILYQVSNKQNSSLSAKWLFIQKRQVWGMQTQFSNLKLRFGMDLHIFKSIREANEQLFWSYPEDNVFSSGLLYERKRTSPCENNSF